MTSSLNALREPRGRQLAHGGQIGRFAERDLWNILPHSRSVRLDAGELDHLGPLLGFVGYELAEIGRRARKYRAAEVGQPRLNLGIGEGCIDPIVELVDDFDGRGLRCADAEPETPFVYRVPEIVTRGRFPDGGESDSTWRTQEARHVGSDTIAPGF